MQKKAQRNSNFEGFVVWGSTISSLQWGQVIMIWSDSAIWAIFFRIPDILIDKGQEISKANCLLFLYLPKLTEIFLIFWHKQVTSKFKKNFIRFLKIRMKRLLDNMLLKRPNRSVKIWKVTEIIDRQWFHEFFSRAFLRNCFLTARAYEPEAEVDNFKNK